MLWEPAVVSDAYKALSDPIRWNILQQIAGRTELPCSRLEETLPVSKPTISYHTKVLTQVGLIEIRKRGRHIYYAVKHDTWERLIGELQGLAPDLREMTGPDEERAVRALTAHRSALGDQADPPAALPTW